MTKIARSYIYQKFYPKRNRMTCSKIFRSFWDFYALELLNAYSDTKGMSPTDQIRVNNLLQTVTRDLLTEQIKALEASVRGEARHFINACRNKRGYNDTCVIRSKDLRNTYKKSSPVTMPLETIAEIFSKNVWTHGFGGKSWCKATHKLIMAKKILESSNLKEMIVMVDSIFDVHHNNGFVLNKTNFQVLHKVVLNIRKEIKNLNAFTLKEYDIIKISPPVQYEVTRALKEWEPYESVCRQFLQ
jgi:hypothetical protein